MEENIQNLVNYFDKTFSLENLEKNAYYVHKLNESLNLRLQDVLDDRNVKAVSKNQDEVVAALKKCSKINLKQEQSSLTLNVPLKQILTLNVSLEGTSIDEFRKFVEQFLPKNAEVNITEEQDQLNLKFKNDQDFIYFNDLVENDENFIFQNKKIDIQIQQEKISDVYSHLKNSVMKKSQKYQHNNPNYVNPNMVNGQNAKGQQNPDFNLQMWQQSMIEAQIQQMILYQDAQLFNTTHLTHLSQPQDYSDLYIRRARNDRGTKKSQNFMPHDFMDPLNPYFVYQGNNNGQRNRRRGGGPQERGRQINRKGGPERSERSKSRPKNQNVNGRNNVNNNNNVQQNRNNSKRIRSRNNNAHQKSDKQTKPAKVNANANKKAPPAKPANKPLNILDDDENAVQKSSNNNKRSNSKSNRSKSQKGQDKAVYLKKEDVQKTSEQEKSKEVFIKKEEAEKLNLTNKEDKNQKQKDGDKQKNQEQENQGGRNKSVSFSKQPKVQNYKQENKSTSKQRKESKEVQYVPKMDRPRADSQSFEPLLEKKGDHVSTVYYSRKQPRSRSHSKQNELKVPSPLEPYVETREKIDRQYNQFEIITSFERWKLQKNKHVQIATLMEKYKTIPIPVISNYPQAKLEVEQPFRQNSNSVTPLLKAVQNPSYRKGSAQYFNVTQSPAINNRAKTSTRKYSSKN